MMRSASRRGFLVAALFSALALLGAPLAQASQDQSRDTTYDSYVALGDSYTAGPFIPTLQIAGGCYRSTNNYPALVAGSLGITDFTDVSCSGAQTKDMTQSQLPGVAPQFDALTRDTELVTVSIGGNDFNVFGQLVTVCPALRATDPDGAPCREHFGGQGRDVLRAALAGTRDRVDHVVEQIRQRSPEARILVIGYPQIVPSHGTCPDILPFATGDYRYVNSIEKNLNAALRHAAHINHVTYVDVYRASRGHDACSDQPWINGQHFDPAAAANYHPFEAYMVGAARLIEVTLAHHGTHRR